MMKQPKRKMASLSRKQTRAGYLFVLPVAVGMLLVLVPMLIQTIWFSFCNVEVNTNGYTTSFLGLYQYKQLLTTNAWYLQTAVTSLGQIVLDFFSILVFSFFIGVLLNQNFHGRTAARVIFFLPVILSSGIITTLEAQDTVMSAVSAGAALDIGSSGSAIMSVEEILYSSVMNYQVADVIISMINGLYTIIVSSGVQILLFLAGLQSIPGHLYEAARVEGASGWEAFWKITLPMISPIILVNGVYTVIDSCTKSTNPVMDQALKDTMMMKYSLASAEAILYLLAVGLIVLAIFGISRRFVFYQE